MSKLTKSLLALAVILLLVGLVISAGLVNVGGDTAWFVALPAGAIFLGLFLISYLLEKETAHFDADHHARLEKIRTAGDPPAALATPAPAPGPAPADVPVPPPATPATSPSARPSSPPADAKPAK